MNPEKLLKKYFTEMVTFEIVLEHSRLVAFKAVEIAQRVNISVDIIFIEEAAILHDIGIGMTSAPKIGCFGQDHYITHGIHGRRILESEGFPRHALVCERHIGVGLTTEDIKTQDLPLPCRDMSPTCIEEEIICFADLFYSKKPGAVGIEKSPEDVRKGLNRFGQKKVKIFDSWIELFVR
jgi:uncharacterized protein